MQQCLIDNLAGRVELDEFLAAARLDGRRWKALVRPSG